VRFVSATHRDLRDLVPGGDFREDLYFRLAVLPVRVPPLRDRPDDLLRLVEHFAPQMLAAEREDLCRELVGRRLPGNVRELRNIVERANLLGRTRAIDPPGAAPAGPDGLLRPGELPFEAPFQEFQREAEREYLRRLLVRHAGHVADAAQAAGINRTYFYRLLRKYML
jgi:two-component system response regulator GlrR